MRKLLILVAVCSLILAITGPVLAMASSGDEGGSSSGDGDGSSYSGSASGNAAIPSGNSGVSQGSTNGIQVHAGSGTTTVSPDTPTQEQARDRSPVTNEPSNVSTPEPPPSQHQDQTQFMTANETINSNISRQRDRDIFLQQISLLEQNASRDQDRKKARVSVALSTLSLSGNVTGRAAPEITRLAAEINSSFPEALKAEQQLRARNSFIRVLFGGDREAAGLLIQYADQNQRRTQQIKELVVNCSDCDPQVRVILEEQVQALSQEQNRFITLGRQEQENRGLLGGLIGGLSVPVGSAPTSAIHAG